MSQTPSVSLRWVGGHRGGPCGNGTQVSVCHVSLVTLGVAPVLPGAGSPAASPEPVPAEPGAPGSVN